MLTTTRSATTTTMILQIKKPELPQGAPIPDPHHEPTGNAHQGTEPKPAQITIGGRTTTKKEETQPI